MIEVVVINFHVRMYSMTSLDGLPTISCEFREAMENPVEKLFVIDVTANSRVADKRNDS